MPTSISVRYNWGNWPQYISDAVRPTYSFMKEILNPLHRLGIVRRQLYVSHRSWLRELIGFLEKLIGKQRIRLRTTEKVYN